jgi:hypothetical protein
VVVLIALIDFYSDRSAGDLDTITHAHECGAYYVGLTDIIDSTLNERIIGHGGPKKEMSACRTYSIEFYKEIQPGNSGINYY